MLYNTTLNINRLMNIIFNEALEYDIFPCLLLNSLKYGSNTIRNGRIFFISFQKIKIN